LKDALFIIVTGPKTMRAIPSFPLCLQEKQEISAEFAVILTNEKGN
jgi:hypothetical protein